MEIPSHLSASFGSHVHESSPEPEKCCCEVTQALHMSPQRQGRNLTCPDSSPLSRGDRGSTAVMAPLTPMSASVCPESRALEGLGSPRAAVRGGPRLGHDHKLRRRPIPVWLEHQEQGLWLWCSEPLSWAWLVPGAQWDHERHCVRPTQQPSHRPLEFLPAGEGLCTVAPGPLSHGAKCRFYSDPRTIDGSEERRREMCSRVCLPHHF